MSCVILYIFYNIRTCTRILRSFVVLCDTSVCDRHRLQSERLLLSTGRQQRDTRNSDRLIWCFSQSQFQRQGTNTHRIRPFHSPRRLLGSHNLLRKSIRRWPALRCCQGRPSLTEFSGACLRHCVADGFFCPCRGTRGVLRSCSTFMVFTA